MELIRAARSRSTVTYGTLMRKHGLSRGRRLSEVIAEADRAEARRQAPGFAAIIVRKDTGFPGGGYFCDEDLPPGLRRDRSRSSDPSLSREERKYVTVRQLEIWEFYGRARRKSAPTI